MKFKSRRQTTELLFCCKTAMLFRLLILVHVCAAFPFKCPEPAQRSIRARGHCPDQSKYSCLENDLINGYSENCTIFDFQQPGRKIVLRGGLDADICSSERYQPWPINFYTNVRTNCIFLKSACNDEGQVTYDNGNRNTGRSCRCDYTRGYDFITKPRNPCFCVPTVEDCSCFLKTCDYSTSILLSDYECVNTTKNISSNQCSPITIRRGNTEEKQSNISNISRKDNISSEVGWQDIAKIPTFVFCIGLILIFCANGLLDKYYRNAYFLYIPPDVEVIEGTSVLLEYKLLINRFPVVFWKNGVVIKKTNLITMKKEGRSMILQISYITSKDEGIYCAEAAGVKSKLTRLFFKPLFKRPLESKTLLEGSDTIFECETEEVDSPVQWFKDSSEMNQDTSNMKMETLLGHIHRLTFLHTSIQDGGKYTIKKNGICSEAFLYIKAMFKRSLESVTILEGSETIFECQTEDVDSRVEWFKDDHKITDDNENIKTCPSNIHTLTISYATCQDGGKYKVEKNGIFSEAVLIVKAMFTRHLANETIMESLDTLLECETEDENSPVYWYHNDVPIRHTTSNKKSENCHGHIYKLIITKTCLRDSGKYSIKKKGIYSTAVLDVKEMPEAIKEMSVRDREEFLKAAKSGTKNRYNITVMIVGENTVGKTCLLRRLMNEPIDDVKTTDGIDIQRRKCQINVNTGEWHFSTTNDDPFSGWSIQSNEIADCGFWDFAGQKEFYATHQAFLSRNAIYLLTTDISTDFKEKTYNAMIEKEFDFIGGYIDFWLDNIHCYCTDNSNEVGKSQEVVELNPPVLIIGTGIDKFKPNKREEGISRFKKYLDEILSDHTKRRHLRKPHFLSNTCSPDETFEKLRHDIFEKAQSSRNWGENLPTRWIVLEKEMYRKITTKEYIISYDDVIVLAAKCSFSDVKETTLELDSFLKYQHDIGNIIFFEDVKNFIILDVKWLVEVFKCFVSHKFKDELIGMPEWSVLRGKGKLSNNLILELLGKERCLSVSEHTNFVLQIMEKFDIIVRPKNDTAQNDLYMPCMMKPELFSTIIKRFEIQNADCKRTSWYCLEFNFLPPAFFNHILVSFVKSHILCVEKDHRLSIYRNIGIFDINSSGSHKLVVRLSKNLIAMQVWQWNDDVMCYSEYKNQLLQLVNSIKRRYRMNIEYERKFQCSLCINEEPDEIIDYDTVLETEDFFCSKHKTMHASKDIYSSWLTEIEQCVQNCEGLGDDALNQIPSDVELQRFSSGCDESTIQKLAIHLGMTLKEWEELVTNYRWIDIVKLRILVNWREKNSGRFSNLAKALTDMDVSIHTLCQVKRIRKGEYDISEEYMDLIPSDEIIDELAQVIGAVSFQLGIELELPITSLDIIQYNNDRNLVAQCKDILYEWREQGVRPTIGVLVNALIKVGRGSKCLEGIIKRIGVKKYIPQEKVKEKRQGKLKTRMKKLKPLQNKYYH